MQQKAVSRAEHGSSRTDPEPDREDRGYCNGWITPQSADAKAKVSEQIHGASFQ
jgi:hypothetical protein